MPEVGGHVPHPGAGRMHAHTAATAARQTTKYWRKPMGARARIDAHEEVKAHVGLRQIELDLGDAASRARPRSAHTLSNISGPNGLSIRRGRYIVPYPTRCVILKPTCELIGSVREGTEAESAMSPSTTALVAILSAFSARPVIRQWCASSIFYVRNRGLYWRYVLAYPGPVGFLVDTC